MKILGRYLNGNVLTTIFSDGTLVRQTNDDEFRPAFASNMDIKICNRCDRGCPWCHEGSTPDGKLADIMHENFIDTLHPYQEVALGGGNVLEHPDLIPFLRKLKRMQVIPNITLNQMHFEDNISLIQDLVSQNLVYGIGVSLENPTEKLLENIKAFPNAVIHVINGIVTFEQLERLFKKDIKLLILGYKDLRRGYSYIAEEREFIFHNQRTLENFLPYLMDKFAVVSFDNLAIEQLDIKSRWSLISDEPWEEFYAGDDGTNTYYIDMVERKFAKSSTEPNEKRYDLLDNVDEMFRVIRNIGQD